MKNGHDKKVGGRGRSSLRGVSLLFVVALAFALTTAMIAGFDDLDWIATAGTRAGLLIASDGRVRRWSGGTRILADGAGLERFGRLPQAASA